MLLDPGMNLTLRPMRYPHFYERYRDAIKNTWTVEEVDLHTDLKDLQRSCPTAERHLVSRLVAFFATGDTIVANNLVLNLYQHVNSPEGRLYLSRQLFEEAVHVQFYLTLLDTYVPDEKERHEAFAAVDNIPSIKHKADFCFRWIDSVVRARRASRRRSDRRSVPAQPDLLRGLHRGAVLLRRLRLRLLPALARPAQRAGLRDELGVPRRVDAHGVRLRRGRHRARARSRTCSTTSSRAQVRRDARRRPSTPRRSSPRTCSARASPGCPPPTCAPTWSTSPTSGWQRLGLPSRSTARRTRSRSWSCRTCRSSRTSSSAGSRRTRSGVTGSVSFDDDF